VNLTSALVLAHVLLATPSAALGGGTLAADGRAIALFPVQNRAGDSAAAAAVDESLRSELGRLGRLVGPGETRDALRRLRIRNGDRVAPLLLRQLGAELTADWLASATLHEADRSLAPGLTLSVRLYSTETGELLWTGFRGESGLDRRTLLGMGRIADVEALAPLVARDLLRDLPQTASGAGAAGPREPRRSRLGTVAVVPFTGSTDWQATLNAEAVTEAAQARLFADGVRLVSPNRLHDILRRLQGGQWGGVTAETRAALERTAAADTILTGAVETYELGGGEAEPEPAVAIGLRLLDASTGRILWTGSSERRGWDHQGLFRRGRVYSRGALTARVLEGLARRLDREGIQVAPRPEGQR
jgi:TolB-like protein